MYPPPCSQRNQYGVVCQSCLAVYSPCRRPALLTGGRIGGSRAAAVRQTRGVPTTAVSNDKVGFGAPRTPRPNQFRDHTTAPGYTRMSHPHSLKGPCPPVAVLKKSGLFLFKIQPLLPPKGPDSWRGILSTKKFEEKATITKSGQRYRSREMNRKKQET